MKKFIVILVILGLFGTLVAFSQHNTPVSDDGQMIAKVIRPFLIWDITPNATPYLADVIKGQKRTFNPDAPETGDVMTTGAVMLFRMQKESDYNVSLTLTLPNPVSGVKLLAQWYFLEEAPPQTFAWPSVPKQAIGGTFNWYDVHSEGWIALLVSEIDATASSVTTGDKTFTAKATGKYTGL
jgi:hypothetical protein